MPTESGRDSAIRVAGLSVQLMLHVAGAVLGAYLVIEARFDGFSSALNEVEKEVIRIQGTRFTADDGKNIWQAIYRMQADINSGEPPEWFVERIDRLESRLDRLEQKIGEGG